MIFKLNKKNTNLLKFYKKKITYIQFFYNYFEIIKYNVIIKKK